MLTPEDALKFMQARATRRKQASQPSFTITSPLPACPSVQLKKKKKRKEPEGSFGRAAQKRKEVRAEKSKNTVEKVVEKATESTRVVQVPVKASVRQDPDKLAGFLDQLVLEYDVNDFELLGSANIAERAYHVAYEALSSFSWLRSKVNVSDKELRLSKRKLSEADKRALEAERKANKVVIACNSADARSTELQAELEVVKIERTWALKKLEEARKAEEAVRAELRESRKKIEYYKDKSLSIEMYTYD